MNIFLTILALGFLLIGIVTNQKSIVENDEESQNQRMVLSEETEVKTDQEELQKLP